MSLSDVEMKAEAWDALVASYTVPVAPGFGYRPWDEALILERDEWIRRTAAVSAEPVHTVLCTMTGMEPGGTPKCIGYHCPRCGMPTSSQGHTSRRACAEALKAYEARERGIPTGEAKPFHDDLSPKPWPGKRPARKTGP